MNYYYISLASLLLNFILLICLFSPNATMFIHGSRFKTKENQNKLPKIIREMITKEVILVVNKSPKETDYISRAGFDNIEVGDYINRFTTCRPYSKGKYDYNGTRKVTENDKENKILTLVSTGVDGKNYFSKIYYSGKEHHGMTEEGMTLRGSESFECYYNEKYTKSEVS